MQNFFYVLYETREKFLTITPCKNRPDSQEDNR
jgi:hypothetical protein